jgi:hypothetical protein
MTALADLIHRPPRSPEVRRYADLAAATDRLRIAQAVLDHLVSGPGRGDPLVVRLASAELVEAAGAYLRCLAGGVTAG